MKANSSFKSISSILASATFGFLFILFCFWGLPQEFTRDYPEIYHLVQSVTYREIGWCTLNPLTPGWFFTENIAHLRPLGVLSTKLFWDIWDQGSPTPFIMMGAIFSALFSGLLFFMVRRFTEDRVLPWLAVILYLTFPMNYITMTSFPMGFEFAFDFLRLIPFVIYGFVLLRKEKKFALFLLFLALFYVSIFILIKIKSSEKILPFVFLIHWVFVFRSLVVRLGWLRVLMTGLVLLLLIFSVVPARYWGIDYRVPASLRDIHAEDFDRGLMKDFQNKEKEISQISAKNLYVNLVKAPKNKLILLRPVSKRQPVTFFEHLGFFGSWFFVFLVFWVLRLFMKKKKEPVPEEVRGREQLLHDLIPVLAVWTGAIALTFACDFTVGVPRYLSFILLPGTVLFFAMTGLVQISLSSRISLGGSFLKQNFYRVAGLCLFLTIIANSIFFSRYLCHFGGRMLWAAQEAEKKVYELRFGHAPTPHELHLAHDQLAAESVAYDWHDSAREKLNLLMKTKNEFYFISAKEDSENIRLLRESGARVERIGSYPYFDAPPPFFRLIRAMHQTFRIPNHYPMDLYRISDLQDRALPSDLGVAA